MYRIAFLLLLLSFAELCVNGSSADAAESSERVTKLIQDCDFAEGFGAAFIYGSEFSGGRKPPLGKLLEYRDISPWQVQEAP